MKKPNILMIMADQYHADWMSCTGHDFVETPHIDSIAEQGIRFTRAACNSPLCAPSRASMTSGLLPHRLGVLDTSSNFPLDRQTMYQDLRKAGYRVAVSGKTDLHKPEHYYGENGDMPIMYHFGFTDPVNTEGKSNAKKYAYSDLIGPPNKGAKTLAGPYQKYLSEKGLLEPFIDFYQNRMELNPHVLSAEDYHDSFIGQKACDFLDNVSLESPWHLFVSFVGPHSPWDAPEEYFNLYKNKNFPVPIKDPMNHKPNWAKQKQQDKSNVQDLDNIQQVKRHYAAMIKLIDDYIGKILEILTQKGLKDDTIIIFCADHGEMMGEHGLFKKTIMYEGALRIPLIIADPRFEPQGTSDALVDLLDMYPTMMDWAGIDYSRHQLEGKSLLPLMKGETKKHKDYQISMLENCQMIFDGRYKLINNINDLSELYDLETDPDELENLIDIKPQTAKELSLKLKNMIK